MKTAAASFRRFVSSLFQSNRSPQEIDAEIAKRRAYMHLYG